jgi:hypothetical protein
MEVNFADSFAKSIKRLNWQEGWIYKSYSLFRYDIPHFIANIWRFKKALWNHQWFDYRYTLDMFSTSLSIMEKNIRLHGNEVEHSRDKKVAKMQRVLELLKNDSDDNYIERAEEVLGKLPKWDWEFEDAGNGCSRLIDKDTPEEKEHSKKVFEYAHKLEEEEWNELWEILKGQNRADYDKFLEEHKAEYTEEDEINYEPYNDWSDGSGLKSWWD